MPLIHATIAPPLSKTPSHGSFAQVAKGWMSRLASLCLLLVCGGVPEACLPHVAAQGVLVIETDSHWRLPRPHHPHPPITPGIRPVPLMYSVQKLDISARIRDSVAKVQMSQTFVNEGSTVVEARCIVPVPYDVIVNEVTFMVDGKEIEGKLMKADDARSIYQSYVRRSQDPALIQWAGSGLLQTSVFPIPPGKERTVTIGYSQELRKQNGVTDWYVPLKAAGYSTQPIKQVSISAYVEESQPLGNIYSPTHTIETKRSGANAANVRFETASSTNLSDFRLLFSATANPLAATWIGYQPSPSEDGFFMLLLHPSIDTKVDATPKDIILVLDKSGSMRGEKIEQARQALLYVLDHLPAQDRVGIIAYDSQVQSFRNELISADDPSRMQSARSFVQSLTANGGTNIDQALDSALALVQDSKRKAYIVHLSDGVPTVGERDERQIVAHATKKNTQRTRIFNFGVGHDVNSKLMDRLSRSCFGQTFYVAPAENIEVAVSGLYDRLQQPALSDLRWELVGGQNVRLNNIYPGKLYDLFAGDQVTVVGRFTGQGTTNLVLTGTLGDKAVSMEQSLDLSQLRGRADGSFIASLWASRRAAAIIDEIDLEGKKEALVMELIDLAQKYGIMTEYTAFLAEEPMGVRSLDSTIRETEQRLGRLKEEHGDAAFRLRSSKGSQSLSDNLAANEASQGKVASNAQGLDNTPITLGGGLGQAKPAGPPSAASSDAKRQKAQAQTTNVQRSGDRAFFLQEGKYIDSQLIGKDQSKKQSVERYSEKYFSLLEKHLALLQPLLDLDAPIIVELDGEIYEL